MSDLVLVVSTFPTGELAAQVARVVVDEGLAACATLVPQVRSIYRWDGATCDETEQLVLMKTTAAGFDALRARLVSLHPYAVPEVIAVPVAAGHAPYLDWVRAAIGV